MFCLTLAALGLPGAGAEPLVGAAVAGDIVFVASGAAGRGELFRELLDLVVSSYAATSIGHLSSSKAFDSGACAFRNSQSAYGAHNEAIRIRLCSM